MKKEMIATENAPAAVGPYSQAVRVGQLVYTAGQIGLDPATGKLVSAADGEEVVEAQTRQVLKNLTAVLEAAGSGLAHVVKTTVFLRYIKDYTAVNQIYAEYFTENPPARSAVAVAALPLGARVEIEVVALVPNASPVSPATASLEQKVETQDDKKPSKSEKEDEKGNKKKGDKKKKEKKGKKGKKK